MFTLPRTVTVRFLLPSGDTRSQAIDASMFLTVLARAKRARRIALAITVVAEGCTTWIWTRQEIGS